MNPVKLYQRYTQEQLVAMAADLEADPTNINPRGGIYRFTKNTHRKLDAIARAITFHLADKREEQGRPVICDGYSGRQSNRRR